MKRYVDRNSVILKKIIFLILFNSLSSAVYAQGEILGCAYSGFDAYSLGALTPGQDMNVTVTGNCTVALDVPYGASLTYIQFNNINNGPKLTLTHMDSGRRISEQSGPNPGGPCIPSSCIPLKTGAPASFSVLIAGRAPDVTGQYMTNVKLGIGSINTGQTYAQTLRDIYVSYSVTKPACKVLTAKEINISFGTINSSDFARTRQYANTLLECAEPTQVTASLTPVQQAVSGMTGVSATTLNGLLMATTWADANAQVIFGYPRSMSFKKGINTVSLGFQPVLQSSVSPTGNFSSQYTLNIVYL
ncbi:fimbrial protein [Pseudomonas iridis]|uniref:Fimbrial protein n=1 Tax=Pseudomonas iridis TaxID=2710587 RepID=A0ABW8DFI0_9PSED